MFRRRILKQLEEDDNNNKSNTNTLPNPKKSTPKTTSIKQSRSHGTLVEANKNNKTFYMSDDPDMLAKGNKKVRRTKSFWKFGKNNSDNEILEGMALWRHRDLVDVDEVSVKSRKSSDNKSKRIPRDKSNDSDRTINNNRKDNNYTLERPREKKLKDPAVTNKMKDMRRTKSFNETQKLSLVPSKISDEDNFDETENIYGETKPRNHKFDDQFYEDDGDGLMLKTVNRKNILQQYNSTGTDSETESDVTSDDPYDCILVEDQKLKKNENNFPNVAELGKKLEKLSKNSKYSPNKEKIQRNIVQEKNNKNMRLERHNSERKLSPTEREQIIKYHDQRKINNFKTFSPEVESNDIEEQGVDEDLYYSQNHVKRNNEINSKDKRRYFAENNNGTQERRGRPSYESIGSEVEHKKRESRGVTSNRANDKRDKMKYYDSTNDELSDTQESRQLLPRTKLTKTNSNNSSHSKYEQEIGLMEYGETLQKRLKNPEYNSKYDEKSPHNGNMYGPWYDLWGLDSTGPIQRK